MERGENATRSDIQGRPSYVGTATGYAEEARLRVYHFVEADAKYGEQGLLGDSFCLHGVIFNEEPSRCTLEGIDLKLPAIG